MIPSYARMAGASQPVVAQASRQAVPKMAEMLRRTT